MRIDLTWSRFKARVGLGQLCPQYEEEPYGYVVWAEDSSIVFMCGLNNGDDIADFEANYKEYWNQPTIPKNDASIQIVAPTIEDVLGLYPKKKAYKNTVIAGQLNFFDIEVSNEKRICGGEYWVSDASKVHSDDYVEFSIIDKNDVLGLFETYNLEVGVDVLELVKFVLTDYIKKGNPESCYHSQLFEGIKGTNKVIDGLFFRVACDSNGVDNFDLIWRLYYYE